VDLELLYGALAGTDGVAIFISPPGDRNATGSDGRPRNIYSGGLDNSVCKIIHHRIDIRKLYVIKLYRLGKTHPISFLQNTVWMSGFREAGRCSVNVNRKVVAAV
jgi:hypothetical protein